MAYFLLNEINSTKDDWAIKVRLVRLWEAVNFKADNTVMGLEMVFLDSEAGTIQAFIHRNLIKKFKPLLHEGQVHVIRNFKVKSSSLEYKVVPCDQRIYFENKTLVDVETKASEIPIHAFFFVSTEIHRERMNNNYLLTDIIGCVTGVGPVEYLDNAKKRMKRAIELASTREPMTVMKLTLWGPLCATFDTTSYTNAVVPVIAAVTSTTIKKFLGNLSYGSTTATRIYFNPDIHDATELKSRFTDGPHNVRALEANALPIVPIAEQLVLNRKTIQEILDITSFPDTEERVYTVLATITGIDSTYGWTYASCPCTKKVEPINGAFYCATCDRPCDYPTIRYKIHLNVSDNSGSATTFVVFDDAAQKLLGHKASTYVAKLGIGSTQVPSDITNWKGRTYVFRLKLTKYNLEDGLENYNVSRIFDVDADVEKQLSTLSKHQVGIDDKKRNADMLNKLGTVDSSQPTTPNSPVPKVETAGNQVLTVPTPTKQDHKKPRTGK